MIFSISYPTSLCFLTICLCIHIHVNVKASEHFHFGASYLNDQKPEIPGNQSGRGEPPIEKLCF